MRATPTRALAPWPKLGPLYVVRYVSQRGETVSTLHRTRPAAVRQYRRVLERGGLPRIYRTEVTSWRECSLPSSLDLL